MARYIKNDAATVPAINAELENIETAINDTLSRKGDTPNIMEAPLDMNSNRLYNLPDAVSAKEPVTLSQLLDAPASKLPKDAEIIQHLKQLSDVDTSKTPYVYVKGFYTGSDVGGGLFYWDGTKAKTEHNVGTIIDPDRTSVWDGTQGDLSTLFIAQVSGTGCWIRLENNGNLNVDFFGAVGLMGSSDFQSIQAALEESRNVTFEAKHEKIYYSDAPIKLRAATKVHGNGQQATRIGEELTFYSGVKKTNNSTVEITNPERPTQVVDCLFYCDGQWENGKFPQNFKITDAAFKSDSASAASNCLYQIQGSGVCLENVDIYDFATAFDGYEVWSNYFKKVRTNGKMIFRRGTSTLLDQCASSGTGNSGLTSGGFVFEDHLYSTLNSCSSDATPNSGYTFLRCSGIVMNGCGSEFCDSSGDAVGYAIHMQNNVEIQINGFTCASSVYVNKAPFSVGASSRVFFNGGSSYVAVPNVPGSENNYDIVITGGGTVVQFDNYRFHNGSYDNPKIRFEPGVISSAVIVRGNDGKRKLYKVDGAGTLTVSNDFIESGSNANGSWVKYPDGTLECWHTLPKESFLNAGPSASTVIQGLNLYRSNVVVWSLPVAMLAGTTPNIQVQPMTSTTGTRLVWARHSTDSLSATSSGQIQMLGLEDFISGQNGYEMIQGVSVRAIGKWK